MEHPCRKTRHRNQRLRTGECSGGDDEQAQQRKGTISVHPDADHKPEPDGLNREGRETRERSNALAV